MSTSKPKAKTPIERAPVAGGDLEARKRPLDTEARKPKRSKSKEDAPFDSARHGELLEEEPVEEETAED